MRSRRVLAVVQLGAALVAAGASSASAKPICPRQRDACVDRLVSEMQRNIARLGCDHNASFALLYERTTEGIRSSIRAGAFSDRPFWNQITTAFGRYYLDAFGAWRRGHPSGAPEAWKIAFRAAERGRVSTVGDLFLGINAHVNQDLAFVYARLRVSSHADHLVVNKVLAAVQPVVLPLLATRYDPTLALQSSNDPSLSLDIYAWRELAWRNARRLRAARARAAHLACGREHRAPRGRHGAPHPRGVPGDDRAVRRTRRVLPGTRRLSGTATIE